MKLYTVSIFVRGDSEKASRRIHRIVPLDRALWYWSASSVSRANATRCIIRDGAFSREYGNETTKEIFDHDKHPIVACKTSTNNYSKL